MEKNKEVKNKRSPSANSTEFKSDLNLKQAHSVNLIYIKKFIFQMTFCFFEDCESNFFRKNIWILLRYNNLL